jgi:hypothetical protein
MSKPCGQLVDHEAHPWGWLGVFAKQCPGMTTVHCNLKQWHGPHWVDARKGQLCRGEGFGAICAHGVQVLDACQECEAEGPGVSAGEG